MACDECRRHRGVGWVILQQSAPSGHRQELRVSPFLAICEVPSQRPRHQCSEYVNKAQDCWEPGRSEGAHCPTDAVSA